MEVKDMAITDMLPWNRGERQLSVRRERGRDEAVTLRDEMERSYGSFRRTIPLPAEVVTDKAEAVFERGVFKINLPKSPESRRRVTRIPVKKA
jgi:HSP20 family protein